MTKYIYLFFCIGCIIYGIYLFSYHLLLGDLLFHTDIARDFLLIQDVAVNHKLTLIGPRAGGIPGVFFGPIWIYLNLPAFIIGNGNPLVVGFFWFLLFLLSVYLVFYVARKVFNTGVAIIAITMFIFTIIPLAPGYTQSFGQMLVSPILFYMIYLFVVKKRIRYLCWSAFLCGLLIQFQIAFGIIMAMITFFLSLGILIRRKQVKYLLVWVLFFIPLSTYILFEVKHNFLETRAVIYFITHKNANVAGELTFSKLISNRFSDFLDAVNLININTWYVNAFSVLLNIYILYVWFKSKISGQRTFILLFYSYFAAFWILTFLFNGTVWDYYYWGLFPLLSISLATLFLKMNKALFLILFMFITIAMVKAGSDNVTSWKNTIYAQDVSSWIVNKKVADFVFQSAHGNNFGFYVYSPDEFGYSMKYAMSYINNNDPYGIKGALCKKEKTTFLIYNPMGDNVYTDPVYWKLHKVTISNQPVSKTSINNILVEKYILTPKQIAVASDPNIICDLSFR